ncbi:unnamed protein product (macronuclear) [Paramecium tetraurelia]|uniref:Peptidase A1 domain-containing protein n=1 Tax=Paramecium tetraurelia TaxID=5888 RepID=A0CSP2_PARTE|nr:uncharacterized protein GSPATT00010081001 [Paramecium tetraurelia]CAK73809.1 unnamed protein product [Paramecium tetraurelia]|eukprot:XP_001441206.1 hypothetical protein (macronuclear) [Paramecium tetraurelia strain d4-2]
MFGQYLIILYSFFNVISEKIASNSFLLTKTLQQSNFISQYEGINLHNFDNEYYALTLRIGTPLQLIELLVDTGSSILWLANYTCDNCSILNRYKPYLSQTYIDFNQTYTQTYGQGECSGQFGQELFSIADTPINTNLTFLLANQVSNLSLQKTTSGIMGLSNWDEHTNIFESAYSNGQIQSPLFGFQFLNSTSGSQLFYGQFNQSVLDQTIWIKTNMKKMWSTEILGVQINEDEYIYFDDHSSIFDSGTTCLLLEQNVYNKIYNDYLNCNLDCDCNKVYPNLTFFFEGAKVTVPDTAYKRYLYNGSCSMCIGQAKSTNILGDPFMKQFISIFNKKEQLVGLYQTPKMFNIRYWYFYLALGIQLLFICALVYYQIQRKIIALE